MTNAYHTLNTSQAYCNKGKIRTLHIGTTEVRDYLETEDWIIEVKWTEPLIRPEKKKWIPILWENFDNPLVLWTLNSFKHLGDMPETHCYLINSEEKGNREKQNDKYYDWF